MLQYDGAEMIGNHQCSRACLHLFLRHFFHDQVQLLLSWRGDVDALLGDLHVECPEDAVGKGLEEVWIGPC